MKTTFKEDGQNYVMEFEGRLDTNAAAQVEKEMRVLHDCAGHDIILDCNKLEYISSSGLRLFLGLLKTARSKHSNITITGLNDDLLQVFNETGFVSIFNIE